MQETSLEAYEEVKPTLGPRQIAVLSVLENAPPLTNTEIAQRLGWSINRVTPRVFELREKDMVRECGRRPCRITGRNAIQWRTTTRKEREHRQLSMPWG